MTTQPAVKPATAIDQVEVNSAALTISKIDMQLGGLLSDMAAAHDHDSGKLINALERNGLSTAATFILPLLAIYRRPASSPLRKLSTFQVQALYAAGSREQEEIIEELERDFTSGHRTPESCRTGIVKVLKAQISARAKVAKDKEFSVPTRSKSAYITQADELARKVDLYELVISRLAEEYGFTFDAFVNAMQEKAS